MAPVTSPSRCCLSQLKQLHRYTTFIPLYPLGASSEALISFSTLPPLSTLPLLPDSISALSPAGYIISHLPLSVGKAFLKTAVGRSLLWNIAKASAVKSKVTPRHWGWLELGRLVNFVIWWPCESTVAHEKDRDD